MTEIVLYTFLLLLSAILGLYLYLTWNFDHWKKQNIPGPAPKPLFGTFPGMVNAKRNFIYDLDEVYKQYKNKTNFIGVFVTRHPQIMILDPEMCKDILITNFKCFQDNEASQWTNRKKEPISGNNPFVLPSSADWKTKRAELVPGVTTSKLKGMFVITNAICKRFTKFLKNKIQAGNSTVDAKEIALHYTGEIVADMVWGIEAGHLATSKDGLKQESTFLNMSNRMISQTFDAFKYFFFVGLFPFIRHIFYVRFFPEITDRFFLRLTHSALQARTSMPNTTRQDLLQHMVELQQKKGISETAIVAHMLTVLFDGFETSATLLSHCLLCLARYPEAQQKLRLEIQEHLNSNSNHMDFDDLMKLPYLEQCIAETLRIFTPLPFMAKVCTQSCEFVNNNGVCLKIQPGDVCLIALHSMHHDEEYYPQPEEFMPERFAEENGGTKKFKDMGVYLPFGDGQRICIGMKFALAQVKAAIVEVIKHFEFTVNERTRKDNHQAADGFIVGLKGGIFLDIKEL